MAGKHQGFRQLKLKTIAVPGDFEMAKRLESPRVADLAKSIAHSGQLAPVIVTEADRGYSLVAGGDRFAAHILADKPTIWASIYQATTREALEMHLIENAHRRHSVEEQKRLRQQLLELYSEDIPPDLPPEEHKAAVIERVARAMAVKPESIERAERRRRNLESMPRSKPLVVKEPIRTLGIELNAAWFAETGKYQAQLTEASKAIIRAQTIIANAAKSPYAKQAEMLRLHESINRMNKEVRGHIPTSLCPYCKALDGAMEKCGPCGGTALVSASQWASIPEELLETGKKAVIYNSGRKYLVSEWLRDHGEPEPEPEKPPQVDEWEALG